MYMYMIVVVFKAKKETQSIKFAFFKFKWVTLLFPVTYMNMNMKYSTIQKIHDFGIFPFARYK